jgi:hypothetical protein
MDETAAVVLMAAELAEALAAGIRMFVSKNIENGI